MIDLLVELGDLNDAFHLLERSRARSFLATLAERDLVFAHDDVPAAVVRKQRQLDLAWNKVYEELASAQGSTLDELQAKLERLRSSRADVADELRRISPRVAALQKPEPVSFDRARRALDPGTLLLSYSVGRTRTLLFAFRAPTEGKPATGALRVFAIPVGEEALRRRVEMFLALIALGPGKTEAESDLHQQGSHLFKDLLGPIREDLLSSRRLLIVPDGPLHALPFAALVDAGPPSGYLGEIKPLHVAASVTVYAELKRARMGARPRQGPVLVAFGAPESTRRDEGQPAPLEANSSVPARALGLKPLPGSRDEVETITALYRGAAVAYLGAEATEAQVKKLGSGPRFIHFACHGLLDDRYPLDSALVLTPDREGDAAGNGLLQAWEVFERMRIDAELVTLSACDSGRGREMGGEGLIGLSRAFQHAGARSVLASLWAVSDRSTAAWMRHFYAALNRGMAKDEAVRAAGAEMRRNPPYAHPFHWAAFQLSGLWN